VRFSIGGYDCAINLNSFEYLKLTFKQLPSSLRQIAKNLRRKVMGGSLYDIGWLRHPMQALPVLRCGIIGFGAMGSQHAHVLQRHPYMTLGAITSRTAAKKNAAEDLNCRWFDTPEQLIASDDLDVIVITTPHWQHADLVIAALRAGKRVVCEKPLCVTSAQADALMRAVKETSGIIDVVFQSRLEPVYQRAKAVLESGELGQIHRCKMSETYWRSDAYYASSSWKATWKGEGGGVLMNQAAHLLDRYVWLCGMPESAAAFCDTTAHPIEVEDIASAVVRHATGCHGLIHANTSENPGLSRTLIACDRGRLTISNGILRVERLRQSTRSHTVSAGMHEPDLCPRIEEFDGSAVLATRPALSLFYENFALAVAGKRPFLVTPEEAMQSVELANAMLLSSATGKVQKLPLDRQEYDAFIGGKLAKGDAQDA
jgi:predicted dehydrogenase